MSEVSNQIYTRYVNAGYPSQFLAEEKLTWIMSCCWSWASWLGLANQRARTVHLTILPPLLAFDAAALRTDVIAAILKDLV